MNLCGTCEHYEPTVLPFGICNRIPHDAEQCLASRFEFVLSELAKGEKAMAEDGSGYYACLRVRPEFGCVLHEPKK